MESILANSSKCKLAMYSVRLPRHGSFQCVRSGKMQSPIVVITILVNRLQYIRVSTMHKHYSVKPNIMQISMKNMNI